MSIDPQEVQKPRKLWRIVRIVREEFDVEAETRAEAMETAENPHTVKVVRETCRRLKDA